MVVVRIFDAVLRFFGIVVIAAMTVLTFADVVGREVFSSPLSIAPELTVLGLAALVYIGLPRVSARDEHIVIGLFHGLFKGRAHQVKMGIVALILAGASAVLARQIWLHGGKLGAEVMILLDFRKAILAYAISAMAGVTTIVFLARAAIHFRAAFGAMDERDG